MSGINVTQVLHDVATVLKNEGFFEDSNWREVLINVFKDVKESDEKPVFDDLDNAHEISNSFAEDHSKFNKKCKKPVDDIFSDLFDDSNASFEIPETQADPPREDQGDDMDDELNSEAFVRIPDDEMQTNDASQSQDLLGGVSLLDSQVNETHESDEDNTTSSKRVELKNNCKFKDDDSDSTDLEMSKLEWNEKEEDNNRSASVTPDLDFLSSTKVADNIKSASVTPDLDFDQFTANNVAVSNLLLQTAHPDSESKEKDISSSMDRKEAEKDIPTISESTVDKPNSADTKEIETADQSKRNGEEKETDATQVFSKPTKPTKNAVANEVETDATQLFIKPMLSTSELKKVNEDNKDKIKNGIDDLEETQLFVKANDLNGGIEHEEDEDVCSNVRKPNRMIISYSEEETDESLVKTDSRVMRSIITSLESADDEPAKFNGVNNEISEGDEYSATTQKFEVKKSSTNIQILNTSDAEADKEIPENNGMETDNDNDENDIATQKFEPQKPKSRKRNHLISSSDEENDDENLLTPMRVESPLPTKSFVNKNKKTAEISVKIESDENNEDATSKILESKKYGFLNDLKLADWQQLCDEANTKQSSVKYVNAFDQFKEVRFSVQNKLSTSSSEVKKGVENNTSPVGNVRKSARNKKRAGNSESSVISDAESKTSKPKKSRMNAPEILPVSSSKSLSTVTKSDVDGDVEMQATQVFVKTSSSVEKEQMKPSRASSRRQAKPNVSSTVTTETVAKNVKAPIPRRLREGYNQSATYSPGPSNLAANVSSDENDNNNKKPTKGDRDQNTNDASSWPTRKRKAEVFPVDEQTEEALNGTSEILDSGHRASRNSNFRVMFTMIDPDYYKSIFKELNITVVNADDNYNALITDRVYRTTKFMCALASGKPIVSMNWLEALEKGKPIPDPFKFLLCDKDGEKKYKFSLAKTLREVGKSGGLFRNHSILVTPSTSPGPEVFKDVITSSGGKYLKTSLVPRKDDIILCISDETDKKMWSQLKKKYPTLKQIINVEGFMQAIFQYNSDLNEFLITN